MLTLDIGAFLATGVTLQQKLQYIKFKTGVLKTKVNLVNNGIRLAREVIRIHMQRSVLQVVS